MESLFLSIIVAKYLNIFPLTMATRARKKFLAKRIAHAISARVHYRDLEHAYVTELDCVALLAINTAGCNAVFFSFFPFLFQDDRTAELPSLCNVVSSFYQLFVPHCAMTVFMCIYLHYRILNKLLDTSFEFSSILSIVDLSKHLITA